MSQCPTLDVTAIVRPQDGLQRPQGAMGARHMTVTSAWFGHDAHLTSTIVSQGTRSIVQVGTVPTP